MLREMTEGFCFTFNLYIQAWDLSTVMQWVLICQSNNTNVIPFHSMLSFKQTDKSNHEILP